MNPLGPMKEESDHGESSSFYIDPSVVTPRPMEGLHDTGPPPFLNKTYDLVDDHNTNHIVSWSRGNHSFVVWDPHTFAMNLLPKHFKHNNLASFVRQLNTYGFRKVDPDKWEFANEGFRRGERHLLKYIRRKKNPSQSQTAQNAGDSCVEVGCFGLDREVDWLRRDRQVLMLEVKKLRQQQQNTKANLEAMEKRLKERELKQQQMMKFLARAIQNACLVRTLVQHNDSRKEMEEIAEKKRPIDHGIINDRFSGAGEHSCKIERPEHGEYEFSELENLAMDMQRISRVELNLDEEDEDKKEEDESSDEGFWKELLS